MDPEMCSPEAMDGGALAKTGLDCGGQIPGRGVSRGANPEQTAHFRQTAPDMMSAHVSPEFAGIRGVGSEREEGLSPRRKDAKKSSEGWGAGSWVTLAPIKGTRASDMVNSVVWSRGLVDRKSTRLNSSHLGISYAV